MQLEEIVLNNFRGFKNYTLRLKQFNVLIGKNSSGKTSLLQAIQLAYDSMRFLFGGGEHPRFTDISWQVGLKTQISRLGLSDTELVFFKKVPEGLQISAKWDNGLQLKFSNIQKTTFKFQLSENDTPINSDKLDDQRIQDLIKSVYSSKAVTLPPVGTISPDERFISLPEMDALQAQGRYNETWRSNLFWIYNDGDKTTFDEVSELVRTQIPGSDVLLPRLSDDNPAKFTIEYSDGPNIYDISSSGGGLRTLISLATVLKLSKASCILLDEPDAHLHSELQRQVAEILLEHTESQNVQMVIATHSPDIIDSVPPDSLLVIDRSKSEADPVDNVGKALVSLGALTNSQAIAAIGAKSIIYIEGDADKIVFSEFAEKLKIKFPEEPNTKLVRLGKKTLKELKQIHRAMLDLSKIDVKIVAINDLDYDSIVQKNKGIREEREERDDRVLLLTLGRKEIENYLLDANAITKAVEMQLQKRRQNHKISPPNAEVISAIIRESIERHKKDLSYMVKPLIRERLSKDKKKWDASKLERETDKKFENLWEDEEWRVCACPGKLVLKSIRTEIQNKWKASIPTRLLCDCLESVSEDIECVFKKLRDFLKT